MLLILTCVMRISSWTFLALQEKHTEDQNELHSLPSKPEHNQSLLANVLDKFQAISKQSAK